MKKIVRITWLVDDLFGEPFVRIWNEEVIASPTLDNPYLEGDLNLLSLIGVNYAETGDWGWADIPASIVEKNKRTKKNGDESGLLTFPVRKKVKGFNAF